MTTSKNYRTEVRTDSDYDEIPSVAVFSIEEATAQRILKLSALVKDHGLYKIEEFDYRTAFLKSGAEDEIDDDDHASTEADCLNVSEREFWFSAIIKHTNVEIVTGRQSIADLASHFGLASEATEEAGKTAPVLNECFEGYVAFDGVRITASFEVPAGAGVAEKDAAFMAALAQQADVNYLSIGAMHG